MHTSQQKIHVLHIPRWYPHRDDPMLGLFVKNHLESLAGKCRNSVIYLHFTEHQEKVLIHEVLSLNGIFQCTAYIRKATGRFNLLNSLLNTCRYFRAFRRACEIVKQQYGKPDLTHVHVLTRPALPALWLKWMHGIPYLISEHWSRYFPEHNAYKGTLRKFITRLALKHSESLVCVSESLHAAMQKNGLDHKKYYTLPNVVDVSLFKPAIITPSSKKTRLIHISCFEDKSKNISGLLKAMKLLKVRGEPVQLELAGDGADKAEMEALAENLSLTPPDVIFSGMLMPEKLVSRLQESDYLIQTSSYETFSTVVAESFACGVPVISTSVGIFPELFDPGVGLLIPSTEPEDIADAIGSAIVKKGSFDPVYLREIAVGRFSNESVGKALFEIYCNILSESK